MNNQWLMRTRTLLGDPAMEQLQNATVAVLGLGGVGGAAAEAVCRMGVGRMILIDNDSIDSTNCNRQLFATAQTVGQSKCLAAKERLLSINPDLELICHQQFFLPENSDFLFEQQPDLILDAIDTVTSKLYLAQQCSQRHPSGQLPWHRKPPGSFPAALGRHLPDLRLRLSACPCDAPRAKKTRRPAADGRLFGGAAC